MANTVHWAIKTEGTGKHKRRTIAPVGARCRPSRRALPPVGGSHLRGRRLSVRPPHPRFGGLRGLHLPAPVLRDFCRRPAAHRFPDAHPYQEARPQTLVRSPALSGARFVTCWTCTTRAPAYSAAKSRWWMQPEYTRRAGEVRRRWQRGVHGQIQLHEPKRQNTSRQASTIHARRLRCRAGSAWQRRVFAKHFSGSPADRAISIDGPAHAITTVDHYSLVSGNFPDGVLWQRLQLARRGAGPDRHDKRPAPTGASSIPEYARKWTHRVRQGAGRDCNPHAKTLPRYVLLGDTGP